MGGAAIAKISLLWRFSSEVLSSLFLPNDLVRRLDACNTIACRATRFDPPSTLNYAASINTIHPTVAPSGTTDQSMVAMESRLTALEESMVAVERGMDEMLAEIKKMSEEIKTDSTSRLIG